MLHIPALWYFNISVTYPQWFQRVKFALILPRFVQQQYLWNNAIQPAVGCYNSWANIPCLGCSPLGEKSLWNGTILAGESSSHPLTNGQLVSDWTKCWRNSSKIVSDLRCLSIPVISLISSYGPLNIMLYTLTHWPLEVLYLTSWTLTWSTLVLVPCWHQAIT